MATEPAANTKTNSQANSNYNGTIPENTWLAYTLHTYTWPATGHGIGCSKKRKQKMKKRQKTRSKTGAT
jgi:hypothetical protein